MPWFEDRLAPRAGGPDDRSRDLVGMGLLAAVAVVLFPAWGADSDRYLTDVAGQMASIYLLLALGFLLALRCGAIDLSVWVVSALAGLVSAWLINRGVSAAWSLAAGAGAGLVVGAVNGALTVWARVPSVLATLLTAAAAMWALQSAFPGRAVTIPDRTFVRWHVVWPFDRREGRNSPSADRNGPAEPPGMPLLMTRMVLVAGTYAAAMLALLAACRRDRWDRRRSLFAALCASGALAGAGGAFWLIDQGQTPVPTRLVDDLRVPAAAVLAGGAMLTGKGRALLAGACLPAALLLATIWRVQVWNLSYQGYALQMLVLIGMTLLVQFAGSSATFARRRRAWAVAGAVLAAAGLLVVAQSAGASSWRTREVLRMTGSAISVAGAGVFLVWRLSRAPAQKPEAGHDHAPTTPP